MQSALACPARHHACTSEYQQADKACSQTATSLVASPLPSGALARWKRPCCLRVQLGLSRSRVRCGVRWPGRLFRCCWFLRRYGFGCRLFGSNRFGGRLLGRCCLRGHRLFSRYGFGCRLFGSNRFGDRLLGRCCLGGNWLFSRYGLLRSSGFRCRFLGRYGFSDRPLRGNRFGSRFFGSRYLGGGRLFSRYGFFGGSSLFNGWLGSSFSYRFFCSCRFGRSCLLCRFGFLCSRLLGSCHG